MTPHNIGESATPQVGIPCSFQFQVNTQGTLLYQVSDPWCVYISLSIGFTIISLFFSIGAINDRILILTNRQVVLMGLNAGGKGWNTQRKL